MAANSGAVLVVEDDLDLREMIQMVLEGAGYRVALAANGQEALDLVAREMPGLILLDMKMPIMNGWEFARAYRARRHHQAPIIVLTAAQDARTRAEEIQADGYLDKPFEIDDLLKLVQRYLSPS